MAGVPEKVKILLVEDDRTMRRIEIRSLNRIGYTDIVEASDGEDAIRILNQDKGIDIIISDWNMPNRGGLELLVWVRNSSAFRSIPFIMATGQGDKIHEKQASDSGVSGFLVKPFAEEELKSTMASVLGIVETPEKAGKAPLRLSPSGKVIIRIAHIQITDHLVMGVLKHLLDKGEFSASGFELELLRMPGWNPVGKAVEDGRVDGGCLLAPLAMDLFGAGTPVKLVLLTHKNGSIFVRTGMKRYEPPFQDFFKGGSFMIPHKMSVQHMLSHMFLSGIGLHPAMEKGESFNVEFEVVPPIDMHDFLKRDSKQRGFMVAEPIGSQAVSAGLAEKQFLSSELWENHPCCALIMRDEFIESYPDALFEFTRLVVKAGKFIAAHPLEAARIAAPFLDPEGTLGLSVDVLEKVLGDPGGLTTNDLYPVVADLDTLQSYMVERMGVGRRIDLDRFVDLRFADRACDSALFDFRPSVLRYSEPEIQSILNRSLLNGSLTDISGNSVRGDGSTTTNQKREKSAPDEKKSGSAAPAQPVKKVEKTQEEKSTAAMEGKYLTFFLGAEEYGISIRNVREIIGMTVITHVPRTPDYVKGVMNLRGKVIPVMDMRIKFGMESLEYSERTCILVVEVTSGEEGRSAQIGVIVDSVSEVVTIKGEEIDENPQFGVSLDTSAVLGMAKVSDRVRILLDIELALS